MTTTWVTQELNGLIKSYCKRWLHFTQGTNFDHLTLPINKVGISFILPSECYVTSQLSLRRILKESKNEDNKNKEIDLLVNNTETGNINNKWEDLRNEKVISHLNTLKESNTILERMKQDCLSKHLYMWKKVCDLLPKNLYVFARRSVVFGLANKSNLVRWKKVNSDECS